MEQRRMLQLKLLPVALTMARAQGSSMEEASTEYSTPNPKEAERYAVDCQWEGRTFKLMLQNRVNMEDKKVITNGNGSGSEYFVTAREENIRPYGFLVKEI